MLEDLKKEIKVLLEKTAQDDIAKQLQVINDLFLSEYKLQVNNMEIIPLETEIYYHNSNQQFDDKMIHCVDNLQNKHFGQLYFHKLADPRGGVDICLSDGEYYLSILLRSTILIKNNEKEFISGPNRIRRKFYKSLDNEEKQAWLRELEKKQEIIIKRNENINSAHIYHQKRIQDGRFKEGEKYKLNSIIIDENKDKDFYLIQLVQPKPKKIKSKEVKNGR